MNKRKILLKWKNKALKILTFTMLFVVMSTFVYAQNVFAEDNKEIVIVIDPGHGGTQPGAEYNDRKEKDLTIKVSEVFAKELSEYDGVKVYLTHDSADDTMSIKARADFAKKVKADYFFCVHFNASGNHNLYGSEAWITSFGRYYSQMYAFSDIVLKEFEDMGVYNRGIKTKLEVDGTDYYGVLRWGAEYDIPAVIIEHCHMDNEEDEQFLDEESDYEMFGKLDAKAVAKFLKLKSSFNGVDYSDYSYELPEEPEAPIPNDTTPPTCSVVVTDCNLNSKKLQIQIKASDEEYPVLYYTYSVDGGVTYLPLEKWNQEENMVELSIDYENIRDRKLLVKVINGFNMEGFAKEISIDDMVSRKEAIAATEGASLEAALEAISENRGSNIPLIQGEKVYLAIAVGALASVVVIMIVIIAIFLKKKKTTERSN